MMNQLMNAVEKADTIAIGGHTRPDGDCIGSCMGLYSYITTVYPNKKVSVYLEEFPESFSYLSAEEAFLPKAEVYDLFISLDCGDAERLGDAGEVMEKAKFVFNVDHHITNTKFGDENDVRPDASSTCQILYTLMEDEKIPYETACALYTGIIYDTGVFKHSNTTAETMQIAGRLMDKGIPFGKIIDGSFYMKSYKQLQIMGRCLLESVRILNNRCVFSVVTKSVMDFYEAKPSDLDGVIDEMRTTEGIEVAILLSERESGSFKVSMRSNDIVDVSKIAKYFGGGGHVRAAGCTIEGSPFDAINNLTEHIEKQLD
ncbi:MAG: bifunctional oligoribonuclease/PAP phosphatase NrnA [Lachnospiraceae bacterium]|nr:bifunctional oligoribonuclease/PAP phosphatase NrnA [Lachnospiraceae bacterium]